MRNTAYDELHQREVRMRKLLGSSPNSDLIKTIERLLATINSPGDSQPVSLGELQVSAA